MKTLSLLTLMHLLVDGVCGAVLAIYALQEPKIEPIVFYFGLYTVFAFGLQGPVGLLVDAFPSCFRWGFIASTLALAIGSLPQLNIGTQAMLLGFGNCLFHVLGGTYVLQKYNTYTELGLFVSSGAIGLGLGLSSLVNGWILLAFDGLITILLVKNIVDLQDFQFNLAVKSKEIPTNSALKFLGVAVLLLSCILLRGFGSGNGLNMPYVMLLPCTLALGKLLGGVICDRIGYKYTVLLIFVMGFLALQLQGIYAGLLFILSCNMTMPLTLRLAHWCRISAPGLMFGLAASCLVPGTIFKGLLSIPPQLILVLQFLILCVAGYVLLPKEYHNV